MAPIPNLSLSPFLSIPLLSGSLLAIVLLEKIEGMVWDR